MSIGPVLHRASQARARAEFAQWVAVIDSYQQLLSDVEAEPGTNSMRDFLAPKKALLEIANTVHQTEQTLWRIVEHGTVLRDRAPITWVAFGGGLICERKAHTIAAAVRRCREIETVTAIDAAVIDYATGHTPGELKAWLDRLIERLEPADIDEAEQLRAAHHVSIDHRDDGMSELFALLPTPAAMAIGKRLRKAARKLDRIDDSGVERDLNQREADLFTAWLTTAEGTDCDIAAGIAVVVEAKALAGVTDTSAVIDNEAPVPVEWVLELAKSKSTLWTRLLTDPAGRVLDVTHLGYQPPQALREAITWRDQTCRVAGCSKRNIDLDHIKPYDTGGKTTASNLRSLCRNHHALKSHGLLGPHVYQKPHIHITKLPAPPLTGEIYLPEIVGRARGIAALSSQ